MKLVLFSLPLISSPLIFRNLIVTKLVFLRVRRFVVVYVLRRTLKGFEFLYKKNFKIVFYRRVYIKEIKEDFMW